MESLKNIYRLLLLVTILILAGCSPDLKITAGSGYTCATRADGSLKCWGSNGAGQLGLGDTQTRGDAPGEMGVNLPVVDLGTNELGNKLVPLKIAAGELHTCAVLSNLSLKCWGINDKGQLGIGFGGPRGDQPGEMGNNLPAVNLGTRKNGDPVMPVSVAVGSYNTCVITNTNDVKCWGDNFFGQLGLGDTLTRADGNNPVIDLGTDGNGNRLTAVALAVEDFGTCALLSNDKVKCWGYATGAGPGEMGDDLPALEFGTGSRVVGITAGRSHTCARLNTGAVKCWGRNGAGQLGLGNSTTRLPPYQLGDVPPSVNLGTNKVATRVVSGGAFSCARVDYGVKCWGSNAAGQLGQGDTENRGDGTGEMGDLLLSIDLGTSILSNGMAAGGGHTCAYLTNETIKCWGNNFSGQLGQGDRLSRGDGPNEMGNNLAPVDLGPS